MTFKIVFEICENKIERNIMMNLIFLILANYIIHISTNVFMTLKKN